MPLTSVNQFILKYISALEMAGVLMRHKAGGSAASTPATHSHENATHYGISCGFNPTSTMLHA